MTVTITDNFVANYSAELTLLAERKSKLKGVFMEEVARGEKHFFDRIGNLTVAEQTDRLAAVTLQDAAHSRRMASVARYIGAVGLDNVDKLKMLADPTNEYSVKLANAMGRKYDDVVLAALVGDAATGVAGAGTASFAAGNIIAEGATGMTVAKLISAKKILAENNADNGNLICAITPQGIADLLGTTQVTSADYNGVKALVNGEVDSFMGIRFITISGTDNATLNIDSNSKRALVFTPDAVKVAVPEQINVRMSERPDLGYAVQVFASQMLGAVRMEEEKVVSILHAF